MKLKLTKSLIFCSILLFGTKSFSQTNLALSGTPSHSGGGVTTYGPGNYNDVVKSAGVFGWVSTGGNPCTNGCWIQYDWSTTKSMNRIVIYNDAIGTRNLTGGTIQSWNGSSWVTVKTFANTAAMVQTIDFTTVSTTRLRIASIITTGSQSSNPAVREIEVYNTYTYVNDVGTSLFTKLDVCSNTQDVSARIMNFGKRTLDSFRVNWSVNGTTQTPLYVKSKLAPPKDTLIVLKPNFNFVNNTTYNFVVWTSLPNGLFDSFKQNDTVYSTLQFAGNPAPPTTTDIKRCGTGTVMLSATPDSPADSITWFDASVGGNTIGRGKNITSPKLNFGTFTFYAEASKVGAKASLQNGLNGGTIVAATTNTNVAWIDLKTNSSGIAIDSLMVRLWQNLPSSTTYEIYYKTGSFVGFETNGSAWTKASSGNVRVATGTFGNEGYIKMNTFVLAPSTQYAFHIAITGNDIYLNNGAITATNADMSFVGGACGQGTFGSIGVYRTWTQDVKVFYRPFSCANPSRTPLTVTVKPSPIGGYILKGAPFQTPQPSTLGIVADPDIVAESDQLTYEINPPTGYTNGGYGTTWTSTISVRTKKGTPVNTSLWSYTVPSSSGPGKIIFKPDATLTDTSIVISMQLSDLGPYFCDSSIFRHIFVAPRPVPDFKFNTPICEGDAVFFDNFSTITSGNITYKWEFGTGNAADTSIAFTPVFKFPGSGTYQVKLIATSSPYGYIVTKTIPVTVNEIPKVNFTRTNACEGQDVILKNTTTIGVPTTITYKWALGDGNFRTTTDVTYKYATPGGYVVTLTATANGCSNSISKNVYTFAKPKPSFTVTNNKCENEPFTFTNTSTISDGQMGHYWFLDDNDEISTEKDLIFMYTSPGTKSVKLRCVSEFGCTDSVVKNVTVLDAPNATFTHSDACSVDPTKFNNNTVGISNPGTTWAWDFGDGTNSSVLSPSHNWTSLGSKNVSLIVAFSNGCVDEEVQTLAVGIQPVAAFNVTDVCAGKPAVFVNNTTWPQGDISYSWDFGDLTSSTLSDPTHVYSTSATTSYNVTLITSIAGGCKDTVTNTFNVNENPKTCDFKWEYDWTVGTPGIKFTPTGPGQPNAQAGVNYTWVLDKEGTYTSTMNPITHDFIQLRELTIQMSAINATGCKCSISKTLNASTGIKSDVWGAEISMYPNPTQGRFVINASKLNLKSLKVEVSNMEGKIVKEVNGTLQNGTIELDGSDLANGIYMVKITGNNTSTIKRISINH